MPDPNPADAKPPVTVFHVVMASLVVGAIVAIVLVAMFHYKTADDANSLIAAAVPSLAAIGTAVFGIPFAYNKGQDNKEEAKDVANKQGKIDVVAQIKRVVGDGGGLASMGASDPNALDRALDDIIAGL